MIGTRDREYSDIGGTWDERGPKGWKDPHGGVTCHEREKGGPIKPRPCDDGA